MKKVVCGRLSRLPALLVVVSLLTSGCSTSQSSKSSWAGDCGWIGGAVGLAVGAALAGADGEGDGSSSGALGAGIALGAAAVGYTVCGGLDWQRERTAEKKDKEIALATEPELPVPPPPSPPVAKPEPPALPEAKSAIATAVPLKVPKGPETQREPRPEPLEPPRLPAAIKSEPIPVEKPTPPVVVETLPSPVRSEPKPDAVPAEPETPSDTVGGQVETVPAEKIEPRELEVLEPITVEPVLAEPVIAEPVLSEPVEKTSSEGKVLAKPRDIGSIGPSTAIPHAEVDPVDTVFKRGGARSDQPEVIRLPPIRVARLSETKESERATFGSQVCTVPIVIDGIHFDIDSSELEDTSKHILRNVIRALRSCPEASIRIEAHTDSYGTIEYNQRLSERRALSVLDFMIAEGVPSYKLSSRPLGELYPVSENDSETGRARNRRVEIHPVKVLERDRAVP